MKKFFKKILLGLLLVVIIFTMIFHKKILLSYRIAQKYSLFQKNISTTKQLNLQNVSTSMNYKDIIYKNTNDVPLSLDIYSPLKQVYKSSPVILYVHGGSWAYGDKTIPDVLSPVLDTFREQGYTLISTSYELMSKKESFEKQISDIKDTIRWIYKNKDMYNLNADEIGIIGTSSGAHLSLMASYSNDDEFTDDTLLSSYPAKVKYVVDFFGPTDLNLLNTRNLNHDLSSIFLSIKDIQEVSSKFNPINYVTKNSPNTLIIHSKNDDVVPYESSEKLYEKCQEVKASAEFISLTRTPHDLSEIANDDVTSLSKGLLKFIILNSPY